MDRRQFMQRTAMGALGTWGTLHGNLVAANDGFPSLPSFAVETPQLDAAGRTVALRRSLARYLRVGLGADTDFGMDMIAVPATRFRMGATPDEAHCGSYECLPRVVHTAPFYLARTPVTQAQWRAVAALPRVERALASSPSCFDGDARPVECVSWLDAQEFCARLTRATGLALRLPSEAEWEAACRAGTRTPFHYGQTITGAHAHYATSHVYAAETPQRRSPGTAAVGQHAPNPLGLQDMHGNVWEWCADRWHDSYGGAPQDSRAWIDGGREHWRSLRGGSWADTPGKLRSANRSGYAADGYNRLIGMRVALSLATS